MEKNRIKESIEIIAAGGMVIVSDDADRENEADIIIAAEKITVEQMAFLIRYSSGIITVPMQSERLRALGLDRLKTETPARFDTPFVMPVDYIKTTRGGVSAKERVDTIRALIDPSVEPDDFGKPGHVFPLEAHKDGLRGRNGHTEAAMELVTRAGLYPAAVIGELMNDDGTMMAQEALLSFAKEHNLIHISIQEMIDSFF